jgi:hypothetical protein
VKHLYLLLLVTGCGGLSQKDAASTTDAVRSMIMIDTLCAPDSGTCDPARVRALDESVICDSSSVLYRNRQSAPDAGVSCPPP